MSGANNVLEAKRDESKKIVGDTCITTSFEAKKDGRWDINGEVEVNRRGAHTKEKQQQLEAIKLLFDSQVSLLRYLNMARDYVDREALAEI